MRNVSLLLAHVAALLSLPRSVAPGAIHAHGGLRSPARGLALKRYSRQRNQHAPLPPHDGARLSCSQERRARGQVVLEATTMSKKEIPPGQNADDRRVRARDDG